MANRIKILSENLANKIAAGEVVERPAAVVKELVENSIDAGARDIVVEIRGGGKRLIRVSDDGCGMSHEDALLALERHATSKLVTEKDLEAIQTLGFRGEAIPSIASVARFTLSTRERENVEGTEIYVEGGRIVSVKACGMACGTVIEVRNLFFNTPARLKFMRSAETEAGHVGEILTRLAISRPDIRFTYLCDGKTQFRGLEGDLSSRVSTFFGLSAMGNLWPLEQGDGSFSLKGLVSEPALSRSTATGIYTYINGRFIRDRVVQHAILQAYRGVLEKGRYPVTALFIELPVSDLDVNVHPTKHEVRFREQGRVHDSIQAAVGKLLSSAPWVRRNSGKSDMSDTPAGERIVTVSEALTRYGSLPCQKQTLVFAPQTTASPHAFQQLSEGSGYEETAEGITTSGYFSSLTVLGQFNAMYILCQDGHDLILIDQHAAHERIAFQNLRLQHKQCGVESQGLLFPETIDLSFVDTAAVREHGPDIMKLGFDLENFGGMTHALKGVPRLLAHTDYRRALLDILSELVQLSRSSAADESADELLARIACHSVVRGSHPLSSQEIRSLLLQMDQTDFAATCPHGRPVLGKITLGEIEKMFKRPKSVTGA